MAKAKKTDDRRTGRTPISPSGATRPAAFRISPAGIEAIQELSDRLQLRSQAGAIETAAAQLLDTMDRCDAHPPLTPDQLALAVAAVRAARLIPRTLGPTGKFGVALLAAILAHEGTAVPADCSADEYAALVAAVKRFSAAESLWVLARAMGG